MFGPEVMRQLRSQAMNAGALRGQDGSPHPFGWTGGLQPLEKRGDWLVDCCRLRCADDAAAGKLHGAFASECCPEGLCEDFLHFCTLAERHRVAPAGFKRYKHDAWPDWSSVLQLAATGLHEPFSQADAAAKWRSCDAMSRKEMLRWLRRVAEAPPPWGRSLRYTAEVVADVVQATEALQGKWGWLFADRQRKEQATMVLGSFVSWEELHRGVQQARQQRQQQQQQGQG
ncbi:hypothetical protein COO60DRAFT_1688991 [Scenedesmus sp. NREL 46B-D3]|nr:hypothetical protein COO60DRAFT_1688991 [Scenedesmus sp. NREL 46B-D3]